MHPPSSIDQAELPREQAAEEADERLDASWFIQLVVTSASPTFIHMNRVDNQLTIISSPFGCTISKGKYVEAKSLYERTIAIAETASGTDGPSYSRYLSNIAGLLEEQVRATTVSRPGIFIPFGCGFTFCIDGELTQDVVYCPALSRSRVSSTRQRPSIVVRWLLLRKL